MQVQKIQSTNNYSNPNFNAKFVYDRAGNFRYLWETSSKSSEFNSVAEQFSKIKNGILEITNIPSSRKLGNSTYHIGTSADYTIFNHITNKEKKITIPVGRKGDYKIEYLINKLMEDMDFFKVVKRDNFAEKTHAAIPAFLKDQRGYFEILWANSAKSSEYADIAAKFTEVTEKGSLEVYDMNKFTGGVHEIFDKTGRKTGSERCLEYDIINRKTGAYSHYIVPANAEYKLENLLEQIMADKWITKPSKQTQGYKNLLGLK